MTTRRIFAAASIVMLAMVSITLRLMPTQADANTAPPDMTHLKALYAEKCSPCHNLPDAQGLGLNRQQWQRTVDRMLIRYKASDSITTTEAAQIVDYLSTFAPTNRGFNRGPRDPWATDALDVWTEVPTQSRVFNFEQGVLPSSLAPMTAGMPGPAASWHLVKIPALPDGTILQAIPVRPDSSRFALLLDTKDTGRTLDMKVRFQIISGRISPSVGLAYGLADTKSYSVLRYDAAHGTLSLLKIAEPTHKTLQSTSLSASPKLATARPNPGWHLLRLLVSRGQVRGWLDGTKRISIADPSYAGGKVALWTQGDTAAAFDDWTIDFYDASAPAASLPIGL